jgi:hypothetical protein
MSDEAGPFCCSSCFEASRLKRLVRKNHQRGDCDYCGSTHIAIVPAESLGHYFEPLLEDYAEVQEGVHFIAALDEEADGEPLDALLAEDHPEIFSARLGDEARQRLIQDIVDAIDRPDPSEGVYGRRVSELWTRRGNEIWAGADEEYFRSPNYRWRAFVEDIKRRQRFARAAGASDSDPATYLTADVLNALTTRLRRGKALYRAVLDGERKDGRIILPHPVERMRGPRPEHCRRGGRVNPPGIPVLYTATRATTAIAEARPWKGAPVSVATMIPRKGMRLIDLVPHGHRRRRRKRMRTYVEGLYDVLSSIGAAMAEPVNPDDTEIDYIPTQYVAELIKAKGYDGIKYASAVSPGANVALFNLDSVSIESVHLYSVKAVAYRAERAERHDPSEPPDISGLLGDIDFDAEI